MNPQPFHWRLKNHWALHKGQGVKIDVCYDSVEIRFKHDWTFKDENFVSGDSDVVEASQSAAARDNFRNERPNKMEDSGTEDDESFGGRTLLLELQDPPEVVRLVVGEVKDGRVDDGNVDVALGHLEEYCNEYHHHYSKPRQATLGWSATEMMSENNGDKQKQIMSSDHGLHSYISA